MRENDIHRNAPRPPAQGDKNKKVCPVKKAVTKRDGLPVY